MNARNRTHQLLTYFTALVWLINGLWCKVLNLVPRHKQIVGVILDEKYASSFTLAIGISEILIAVLIMVGYKKKRLALLQIAVVITMNVIEFTLVPDLLLWGHFNLIFAILFSAMVYFNNFYLNRN